MDIKEFAEQLAKEKKELQRIINENNEISLQDSQDNEDEVRKQYEKDLATINKLMEESK